MPGFSVHLAPRVCRFTLRFCNCMSLKSSGFLAPVLLVLLIGGGPAVSAPLFRLFVYSISLRVGCISPPVLDARSLPGLTHQPYSARYICGVSRIGPPLCTSFLLVFLACVLPLPLFRSFFFPPFSVGGSRLGLVVRWFVWLGLKGFRYSTVALF